MKIIACGGRRYDDPDRVRAALDAVRAFRPIELLITGGAAGADALAADWARNAGVTLLCVPADWSRHRRAAGPIRNAAMLRLGPDGVVAFPGGPGTDDMVRQARAAGVKVWRPFGADDVPARFCSP